MIWREATRTELYDYYTHGFPNHVDQLPDHVTATGPKEYGVSFHNPHPVKDSDRPPVDFIRRDTWRTTREGDRRASNFSGLVEGSTPVVDFFRNPAVNDPIRNSDSGLADPVILDKAPPVPRAVYHSLAHWERSHIVVVDIDAKDIAYARSVEAVGTEDKNRQEILMEAGIIEGEPTGYPYEFDDIRQALEYGFTVQTLLEDNFAASETMVVYSGQGCHVYLLDDDRHHQYDMQSRKVLAELLEKKYDISIDKQVTIDSSRLIRLPYSLHADVCRVAQPIDSPSFDFKTQAIPNVLLEEA